MSHTQSPNRSPLLSLQINTLVNNDQCAFTKDDIADRIMKVLDFYDPCQNKLAFANRATSRYSFAADDSNKENPTVDTSSESTLVTPKKPSGTTTENQLMITPVKIKNSSIMQNLLGAAQLTPSELVVSSATITPSTSSSINSAKGEQENKIDETNEIITPTKPIKKSGIEFKVIGETKVSIVLLMPKQVPFSFAERVLKWDKHPSNKALDEKTFGHYALKPFREQQKMLDFHSFSVAANCFYYIGAIAPFLNQTTLGDDTEYSVSTEIVRSGKDVYRGRAVWTINDKNECYHKFFQDDNAPKKIVASNEVQEELDDAYYTNNYPTLQSAKQKESTPQKNKGTLMRLEGENVLVSDSTVTITNEKRNNLRVKLFA